MVRAGDAAEDIWFWRFRIPHRAFINGKPGSNRERVEDLQLVHFRLCTARQPVEGEPTGTNRLGFRPLIRSSAALNFSAKPISFLSVFFHEVHGVPSQRYFLNLPQERRSSD